MAFLAPLAPLVLPALVSSAAAYGVNTYMQSQAKKNAPAPVAPQKPQAVPAQSAPAAGSYRFDSANPGAVATGGDAAIALDPLGKTGAGAAGAGRTSMLGR